MSLSQLALPSFSLVINTHPTFLPHQDIKFDVASQALPSKLLRTIRLRDAVARAGAPNGNVNNIIAVANVDVDDDTNTLVENRRKARLLKTLRPFLYFH